MNSKAWWSNGRVCTKKISCQHVYAYGVLADLFYDHRYSHTRMTNPDFVLLAKAMGVHAIRVNSSSELPEKMKEFLEYDGNKPVLLECIVEPNEHVFPMVCPSG